MHKQNGLTDFLLFRFEPAANGIPSSVFFPQTNPDERLSQCSASLQALLALSPTTLHALSKLVNNADIIADEIIGVMRNVVSQYPPKGNPEIDTSIEVPLSVRLWRVSGCHELLASLGFDLMEVGQDQVTLRTGKQANRRNCQFVLQALLALFDTQEAPKSIGIDSSSSCESLNEESRQENRSNTLSPIPGTTTSSQQRSISPVGTVKSLNLKLPRPMIPNHCPLLSSGSAFTSYVRKRGEPDGGRESIAIAPSMLTNIELNTDSDISDGYSTQGINRFDMKPAKINYTNLRAPIKVCARPGGGGESDAAFTPSPPITLQHVDTNVSLALAHQTKIRNLYSVANAMNAQSNDPHILSQRPDDSSSSTSSTNDWEGSGHATVLRRAQQNQPSNGLPPMPPPRLPLVESLRPQIPSVFNNLNGKNKGNNNAIESTSSDSEFERTYESRGDRHNIQKPTQPSALLTRNISEECLLMDRLSVRTENTTNIAPMPAIRKQLQIPDEHDTTLPFKFNANNLYFPSSDSDVLEPQHKDISLTLKANSAKENNKPNLSSHNKNIQDLILRKINREMTPTISDVYHERNMDLGLAPPLSKLLLSKNYEENETKTNTMKKVNSSETVSDINLSSSLALYVGESTMKERCDICNNPSDVMCQCKSGTMISKPWLNNLNGTIQPTAPPSELCNVDLMDRQSKNNFGSSNDTESTKMIENDNETSTITSNTLKRGNSPYSDLSKRDEGDGRSVADSQCSNSYKTIDLNANTKLSQVQQRINKFNMASANSKN